jgi:glycosyltransferase involved in cell wall biosynthesis
METTTKLSVIIPCYNEKLTILRVVDKIRSTALPVEKEILIVCDGSTDGTKELLQRTFPGTDGDVKVFFHEKNMGKGKAVQTGAEHATGDYLLVQDADLELDPKDYSALLEPVLTKTAAVVFGSRGEKGFKKMPSYSRLANHIVTSVTNALYGSELTDQACGYKLLPLALFRSLHIRSNGFEFCAEVTAKVLKTKNNPIREIEVYYDPRSYEQGKKIKWIDGFMVIWTLLRYKIGI